MAAENIKTFPLANILSITTPRLLSRDGIDGVYVLIRHMTGDDSLASHQIVRAADQCQPELLRQHRWLAELQPPREIDTADLYAWLLAAEEKYGVEHPVAAGAPEYQRKDSMAELDQIAGTRPVVTFQMPQVGGGPS